MVAGVLYLITFVSIPTLAIYGPVRDPNYIVGPGPDTLVFFGGVLEMIVALAGIGTEITASCPAKPEPSKVSGGCIE
jgi:hypothetical protein